MDKNLAELEAYLKAQIGSFSKQYQGLILSCSGGLDSTVLFDLFCQKLNAKNFFQMLVLHFNFGLRGAESDADQAFVESIAQRKGIPCHTVVVNPGTQPEAGIQAWAREIRQSVYTDFAAKGFLIATAHHGDDLCENVIFRLARGASFGKLAGFQEYKHPFWRPLLRVSKEDLGYYARQNLLDHRHDASNDKLDYNRNKIRHKVIPELESLYPGVAKRVGDLAREAKDLEDYCREQLRVFIDVENQRIATAKLIGLNRGMVFLAVEMLCESVAGNKRVPQMSRVILNSVFDALQSMRLGKKSWCINLPKGLILRMDQDFVSVELAPVKIETTSASKISFVSSFTT